jgi:hypothetical protein
MSVTRLCRKRVFLLGALAAGAVLTATAVGDVTPIPVKTTSRSEASPAAGADWLAWAKSRSPGVSPYDVWAQHGSDPAFKVNAPNTQGYPGGIDSGRLVYQQIYDIDVADLRLYDLTTRRHIRLPKNVNTKRWECCASLSGDWLLFTRGSPETRQLQLILLRNLVTKQERILDHLRNPRGVLSSGEVNGNFAVWSRCNPYPRCKIIRYDIAARRTTGLPVSSSKTVYGPSVGPNGTAYYLRSTPGCGKSVVLVKQKLGGGPSVLLAFPPKVDADITYAFAPAQAGPGDPLTTRIYFDRSSCATKQADIYRIDDVEPVTLGLRGTRAGSH